MKNLKTCYLWEEIQNPNFFTKKWLCTWENLKVRLEKVGKSWQLSHVIFSPGLVGGNPVYCINEEEVNVYFVIKVFSSLRRNAAEFAYHRTSVEQDAAG